MAVEFPSLEAIDAKARERFDAAKKRLNDSGLIEALQERVKTFPQITIKIHDTYDVAGTSPSIEVTGPESFHGEDLTSRSKSVVVSADIQRTDIAVSLWDHRMLIKDNLSQSVRTSIAVIEENTVDDLLDKGVAYIQEPSQPILANAA